MQFLKELSAPTSWFTDFVGVGYRYHDVYMNVFPLLSNKADAHKLWKRTIDWWPDDKIKLRFVEDGDRYWFILYGGSDYSGDNTGFAKRIQISDNYLRFKEGFESRALLRFGIYKPNPKKGADGYDLELLKKYKSVYDVAFSKVSDMVPGSVEFKCIVENEGKEQ